MTDEIRMGIIGPGVIAPPHAFASVPPKFNFR